MKKPIVINFFGEPSTGKSTAAAYVYSRLKMLGRSCEYVSEFAKDKVYENNAEVFKHQEYLFGKQSFKMARVADKVDIIVTDSPLVLSCIYNQNEVLGEEFNQTVVNVFKSYNNFNILLTRHFDYENVNRNHNQEEAEKVRQQIINKLKEYDISYTDLNEILYDVEDDVEKYEMLISSIIAVVDKEENENEQ
mgnify:CR=1 FL=1